MNRLQCKSASGFDTMIRRLYSPGEKTGSTFSKFLCFSITSKLDVRATTDWENSRNFQEDYSLYADIYTFLLNRVFPADERISEKYAKETTSEKKSDRKSVQLGKNEKDENRLLSQKHLIVKFVIVIRSM